MNFSLKRIEKLMVEALEEVESEDDFLEDKYDEVIDIHGQSTPYYSLFRLITDAYKPKGLVVELGSWRGIAAGHFAVGSPSTTVVTIDSFELHNDVPGQRSVKDIADHYDNVHFIHGWTWDVVDQVKAFGKPIDVLFMDSWHDYQYAIRDWKLYEPLLNNSALVVVGNVRDAEGATVDMVKFWKEISKGHECMIDKEDMHNGIPMGFMKYKRQVEKS